MAQRRMISLSLIDTDKFNDMPVTSRLFYYELSMRADDDGFVSSPKKIARMIGCSQSDLDQLVDSGYLISFDSGIVVITHWQINNQIRKDRHTPTLFQTELSMLSEENGVYYIKSDDCQPYGCGLVADCPPSGCDLAAQDSIGKDSTDKFSEGKDSKVKNTPLPEDSGDVNNQYQIVIDSFNSVCTSLNKVTLLTEERKQAVKSAEKLLGAVSFEEFFRKIEASDFLTGRSSEWRCGFDWVLKPSNLTKILEGNYDNKSKPKPKTSIYAIDYDELERIL